VRGSSALIFAGAIILTLVLVLGGLAGILFGVFATMLGGGGWLIFAAFGVILVGCGVGFVFKVVVPAWKMTRADA
jgi:hypothetical protein